MKIIIASFLCLLVAISNGAYPSKKFIKNEGFVYVPSGSATITFEKNRTVSIHAFYMSQKEITNLQYRTFLIDLKQQNKTEDFQKALPDTTAWRINRAYNEPMVNYYFSHPAYDHYPVVNVSLEGALLFCDWLTEKIKTKYGENQYNSCRIPTSYEWAYAAKGNSEYAYSWGTNRIHDAEGQPMGNIKFIGDERITYQNGKYVVTDDYFNAEGVAGSLNDGADILAPSQSYAPNGFGLYNMCGNAAELVYHLQSISEDLNISDTVVSTIGGSWNSPGYDARISSLQPFEKPNPFTGFRVVITYMNPSVQ